MQNSFTVQQIGSVSSQNGIFTIQVDKEFIPGLTNIKGFEYLQVLWWGHLNDSPNKRKQLLYDKPYKNSPDNLGVFATRSECRPNPILITTIQVIEVDMEKGIIYTPYIDAFEGSAILDIKPYHKLERTKNCQVPSWCAHWPDWYEEAGQFDWQNEFNFA